MPSPRFPRCFLSCSFDADDLEIFDWFRRLLTALEFDVTTGEEPTIRSLPEMVKERISQAPAFVGVLTKKDRVADSDEWLPPAWVRDEVAIAYSLNKVVAILAEEGVRVEGIIPQLTKYERWDRTKLAAAAPTIVRYMVTLRNGISPPIEPAEDLATMRALGEELAGLDSQLENVERTLEISGFKLALITARSTGRLFTLPEVVREKVLTGYQSVEVVEAVLGEVSEARRKARGSVKDLLKVGAEPPLPFESPLWAKLRTSREEANRTIEVATLALFKAGYPKEWAEFRRRFRETPESQDKEKARALFVDIFGADVFGDNE